jgi:membrane-associated protein
MGKLPTLLGPFVMIFFYGVVLYLLYGKIPDAATLVVYITGLYKTYGYTVVFIAGLIEGTFPIGLYVPGSTAVLLGAALTRTGVVSFPIVYLLGTLALLIAYIINYALGRFGWYHVLSKVGFEEGIQNAKSKIEKHGKKAILFGYVWPASATFLSTAAGVLKIKFTTFLFISIISQLWWSFFWGGLAYLFGLQMVEFMTNYAALIAIGVVVVWFVRKKIKKKEN